MPAIPQPRRVVDHQPRRLHLGRHLRQLELHRLKLRQRLAKLLPLLRPSSRMSPRSIREPYHLRANPDASLVQRLDRHL